MKMLNKELFQLKIKEMDLDNLDKKIIIETKIQSKILNIGQKEQSMNKLIKNKMKIHKKKKKTLAN
jgi:hypothetical protein